MAHIRFDWDSEKNRTNHKKHGISFEEAQSVFVDEHALMIHDFVIAIEKAMLLFESSRLGRQLV